MLGEYFDMGQSVFTQSTYAKTFSFEDLSYYGRVYVYLGRGKGNFAPNPDIVISTSRSWTNLGED